MPNQSHAVAGAFQCPGKLKHRQSSLPSGAVAQHQARDGSLGAIGGMHDIDETRRGRKRVLAVGGVAAIALRQARCRLEAASRRLGPGNGAGAELAERLKQISLEFARQERNEESRLLEFIDGILGRIDELGNGGVGLRLLDDRRASSAIVSAFSSMRLARPAWLVASVRP